MAEKDEISERQEAVSAYIKLVRKSTGWSQTRAGKEAGVSKTTIARNENPKPNYRYVMSTTSISKLGKASRIRPPAEIIGAAANGMMFGFAEPELRTLEGGANVPKEIRPGVNQGVWEIEGRHLDLDGYLPGDIVLADSTVQAQAGDAVVAQIIDDSTGTAQSVLRIYNPPYLMTRTLDRSIEEPPRLVDQRDVWIWGTVIKMVRARKPARA